MKALKSQIVTSKVEIPAERVERRILLIRNQKVMLDADLAALYEVETKILNQAVRRNIERFPEDFMVQLTPEEDDLAKEFLNADLLRSQIVTSNTGRGGRRYQPLAFTEQGVAMLSSVLRSPRAVQVNIAIMRAFVKLRQLLASNEELSRRLEEMESRYDQQFRAVFDAIGELMAPEEEPRRPIGFSTEKLVP
jgi:ORF6N domain